ncbi:FUSC family protein [Clostridium perfringens]|uniref:Membrane protein n=1 Tax=Clostridium perfringens (strain ATCC 13124 / DSM 756 / JCM 1290 / NCIMB 6125 / NCTC 8237 / Type A) TaxID=195103 RepID=A0A0H2YRS3_CLOP1|nr:FUSC family protein [Clostridium perfringens]ABG83649.1 putative membrane protein [Clostridium perfringens ATCC 13124]ATD49634.1 FUSC family protein [Clostridium perfringens]EHR0217442.1 FUSC family protein [Clostridium perfringens]EHR0219693.1 FUSC family protein [Clostridium perfringens]EJT6159637.1 FUSC family protein [Clostridium perfringens]
MTIKQMNIKIFKLPLIFAVLSVVLMGLYKTIFGVENTIIGLIIAMASYAFLRLDLTSYPIYKSMIFLILNLFLAISAYISAINPFVGLIINFLILFTVSFIYTTEFKNVISYIFLLLYVYMWEYSISLDELPRRLVAMGVGVFIIIGIHILFNRRNFKKNSNNIIIRSIRNIQKEICHIINESYREKENIYIDSELRKLLILIEGRNNNKFIENHKDDIYFNIVLILERINSIINKVGKINNKSKDVIDYLNSLNHDLENITLFLERKVDCINEEKDDLNKDSTINNWTEKEYAFLGECTELIRLLEKNINNLYEYNRKKSRKRIKVKFNLKELLIGNSSLKMKHLRVAYSLKLAIAVSLIMFIVDLFKIPQGRWIVTSVYVVIQPYEEETLTKAIKRFKGTIIGVIIYISIFTFFPHIIPLELLLLILMFLYFVQKDYEKKVVCTALMTLSFGLSRSTVGYLAFYRFLFVIIGIVIALGINKIIFPQSIKNSIYDLKERYLELTSKLLYELKSILYEEKYNENTIKLLLDCNLIECKLMENKLIAENLELKDLVYKQSIILSKIRCLILFINYSNWGISSKHINVDKNLLNVIFNKIEEELREIY